MWPRACARGALFIPTRTRFGSEKLGASWSGGPLYCLGSDRIDIAGGRKSGRSDQPGNGQGTLYKDLDEEERLPGRRLLDQGAGKGEGLGLVAGHTVSVRWVLRNDRARLGLRRRVRNI